jgi:hypothetical protein
LSVSLLMLTFGIVIFFVADSISPPVVVDPVGPSAWPKILAAAICILAIVQVALVLFKTSRGSASEPLRDTQVPVQEVETEGEPRLSMWALGGLVVLASLYVALLDLLGYYVATPLFVLGLLLTLGVRSWTGLLVPTIGLAAVWGAAFQWGLGVPLPMGVLF